MKKYSVYLISAYCSFFVGCGIDKHTTPSSTKITRIINNESDYPVLIKSYFNQVVDPPLDTVVEINLNTGESHSANGFYVSNPITSSRIGEGFIESLVSVDSVVVVFDNEKFAVHCNHIRSAQESQCDISADRSLILLNPSGFTGGKDGGYELVDKGVTWQYTITNQDYENAVDCNGHPCGE